MAAIERGEIRINNMVVPLRVRRSDSGELTSVELILADNRTGIETHYFPPNRLVTSLAEKFKHQHALGGATERSLLFTNEEQVIDKADAKGYKPIF